jgi:hypothetical protein
MLVSCVKPEYKLMYLVISNSLICHQINFMTETSQKIEHIENSKNTNIPESQNEDMKNLQIKNLNHKYNDL